MPVTRDLRQNLILTHHEESSGSCVRKKPTTIPGFLALLSLPLAKFRKATISFIKFAHSYGTRLPLNRF